MKTVTDVLLCAANLLRIKGWNQDYYARNDVGGSCYPNDPNAVSYCMIGAVYHCANSDIDDPRDIIDQVRSRILMVIDSTNITHWNDSVRRTKEEVIEALEKAAALKD